MDLFERVRWKILVLIIVVFVILLIFFVRDLYNCIFGLISNIWLRKYDGREDNESFFFFENLFVIKLFFCFIYFKILLLYLKLREMLFFFRYSFGCLCLVFFIIEF